MLQQLNLKYILSFSLSAFLFLLPWQTIFIFQEKTLNGAKWEYGTIGMYGTEAVLWVCVFLFIAWYWRQKKFSIFNSQFLMTKDRVFVLACLSFIIYHLSSIIWSVDRDVAFQQSLRVMEALLLFFMLSIGPLPARKAMLWFVAGATLQSMLGIWQFFSQSTVASTILGMASHPAWQAGTSIVDAGSFGRWLRAYGAFPHPNVLGGFLVMSIVFTLILFTPRMRGIKESPYSNFQFSIFNFQTIILIIQCVALFFTFSRSAWIAGSLVVLLYVFSTRKHIIYHLSSIIVIAGILTILLILFFPLITARVSSNTPHEVQSNQERTASYRDAWTLFTQHPMLGVGAGNYTAALYRMDPTRPGWEYQPAHSAPLLVMAELGVVGSMLLIFVAFSFFRILNSRHSGGQAEFRIQIFDTRQFVPCPATAGSRTRRDSLLLVLCLAPLLLFDHYLYSSYAGLLLLGVFFGMFFKGIIPLTKERCHEPLRDSHLPS